MIILLSMYLVNVSGVHKIYNIVLFLTLFRSVQYQRETCKRQRQGSILKLQINSGQKDAERPTRCKYNLAWC